MPYPVPLSLRLSSPSCSFPLLNVLLTPVIRLNISRHDPGYHLPCHTLSAFLHHHPPPIIYMYPSCLSLPPRCCSSSVEGPIYHPPILSIALLPHATLCSTELHKAITLRLPPYCPSVVSFCLSVCVCPSAFLLPRLVTCIHYV